jgi:hypothetical protein
MELKELIRHLDAYVQELKQQSDQIAADPPESALALEYGIESYKATARWARASLKKLERANKG